MRTLAGFARFRGGKVSTFVLALVLVWIPAGVLAQEPPQETVEGEPQAWQEVKAAYEVLTKLKSYRARHLGDPSIVEVVNPDRFRQILAFGPVGLEFIIVGSQYAERFATSGQWQPWRCFPTPPDLRPLNKALPPMLVLTIRKQVKAENVKISRLADTLTERDKTHGYQYVAALSGGLVIRERLFVLSGRELPRRTEVLDAEGKVLRDLGPSVDYGDYDAPITIQFPRC